MNKFRKAINFFLLKKIDDFLLENHPYLWLSSFNIMLIAAFWLSGALSILGFFTPFAFREVSSKIIPMSGDPRFMGFYFTFFISTLFTVASIYRIRSYEMPLAMNVKQVALVILFSSISWSFILGVTTNAYNFGQKVRIAWFWMDKDDIPTLEKSFIYPYTYGIKGEDKLSTKDMKMFKDLKRNEKLIIKHWYDQDTVFWSQILKKLNTGHSVFSKYREYCDSSYFLYSGQRFSYYLDEEDFYFIALNLLKQDSVYAFNQLLAKSIDLAPYIFENKNDVVIESYYSGDWLINRLGNFSSHENKKDVKKIKALAKKYNIINRFDTVHISNHLDILSTLPKDFNALLNEVYKNRAYLEGEIAFKYWRSFLPFSVAFSILIFLTISLKSHKGIVAPVLMLTTACCFAYFIYSFQGQLLATPSLSILVGVFIPLIGVLLIFIDCINKQIGLYLIGFILVLLWLIVVFVSFASTYEIIFAIPNSFVFYCAQIPGLVAILLLPYAQLTPKTNTFLHK